VTAAAPPPSIYAGRRFALLTRHGKERVIAPVLEPALGCRIDLVTDYDTDQLGTFTREIPRLGTQIEAARRKARIGMERAGTDCGLASEGSFGPDPFTGMFSWNVEVLLFIDDRLAIEVCGVFQGAGRSDHLRATEWPEVEAFARAAGFPLQHLVVRPRHEHDGRIRKGIATWPDLRAAFAWAQADDGKVFVEFDLRAHAHPERMENIRRAAEDLLVKLQSVCPACGAPGYAALERVPGLPCAACGAPTRATRAEIWGCPRCGRREERDCASGLAADPGRCDRCNP